MGLIVYIISMLIWGLDRRSLRAPRAARARTRCPCGFRPRSSVIAGSASRRGRLAAPCSASSAGFLLCLVFAVLIMYVIRRSRGGGLTDPGDGLR